MKQLSPDKIKLRERVFKKRAARTRFSRWVGRGVLALAGVAVLLVVRLNPNLVSDAVAFAHDVPTRSNTVGFDPPHAVQVNSMPSDAVPVRHGVPAQQPAAVSETALDQTDNVARILQTRGPGG